MVSRCGSIRLSVYSTVLYYTKLYCAGSVQPAYSSGIVLENSPR